MADNAMGLIKGFAFIEGPSGSAIGVLQFASGALCLFFTGAKMKWLVISGDGACNWMLEREPVAGNRIGSECFISGTPRHVRHVFVGPLLRRGPTAGERYLERQGHDGQANFHKSASLTSTSLAPLSSSNSHARSMS